MKLNPFCMCCAINKQEKKIRDFDDADRKTEYMKKVMKEKWTPERRKQESEKMKRIRKERGKNWRKQ